MPLLLYEMIVTVLIIIRMKKAVSMLFGLRMQEATGQNWSW